MPNTSMSCGGMYGATNSSKPSNFPPARGIQDITGLAQGGAAYVEKIRSEPDERFEDAIRNQTA